MKDKLPSKTSANARKEETLKLLQELALSIYNKMDEGIFPDIVFPSRSVRNLVYDEKMKQYILGTNSVKRSSQNIKHIRPFTNIVWLAFFVNKLLKQGKTSTLRDVYYSGQAFDVVFKDQPESDDIIVDLETVFSRPRESFSIYPEERSAIFGDMIIEYTVPGYEGKKLNLSSHPDGFLIGPSLSTAEMIETSAEMVIAVEKGGLFTRFVEEKVHEKYKAIIVDTAGQAPRSTRFMLKRLNKELNLPVYILTDGDVYGEHIAMVIVSGSANAAHLRDLTVPTAKWIGVWGSDIVKYKLPGIPLTEHDYKRLHELKRDPRYRKGRWRKELDVFLKIKKKSELEAFAKYGLTTIVDKYLPDKLEQAKSF
ncbi:DNA topoisomerase IV subunit A [Thermoproteota archaeon]